jgi:hypothetical protein
MNQTVMPDSTRRDGEQGSRRGPPFKRRYTGTSSSSSLPPPSSKNAAVDVDQLFLLAAGLSL